MNATYRIGQIVPSSNTTMETEIPAMLHARQLIRPQRFTFHSSRMRMHKVTREELEAMNREALRCAAELADARVDVMSTACLVAIMAMGNGYHRKVQEELTAIARANQCQAPVMTSAGALVEGLKIMGAKRISLLAPYMRGLCDRVVEYIESEGIEVVDSIAFEIPDNLEVGKRDPALLLEDVRRLDTRGVDVVVLSACVQMQSLPSIQAAEDALGIPVTSTAVCTVRRMLDHLGLEPVVPGAGALLSGRYPAVKEGAHA
ncbi:MULTISPECIES: aspartate/glutamate racemase family protein [Pseudomonas]|uniref:Maleate isomerase n=1 Tax=Pseudomonas sessilinigenes TaxID=658629 RepID=A0ABX8MWS5_9PSED|nr:MULTISPECIES: aspartate/glutamate racemase family protein [Pseudomonas]AZC24587.1 Maleate cis-trans isomerase [Pseudomonas sessilinigenes]QIH08291.1 Asp/Glu racemase [Pseudomonas sp. BIOMIG1BAC]QXH43517.1 aspartate/glutamate racemase family protein [Pseudomonas sessilinigenes]